MSYCRFGESEVYAYRSHNGYECCACSLEDPPRIITVASPEALVIHLHRHVAKGDDVPRSAFEKLEQELGGEELVGQSRAESATEAATNVASGAFIAWLITVWVLPFWGHTYLPHETIEITALYASAAWVRSYLWRRFFNA